MALVICALLITGCTPYRYPTSWYGCRPPQSNSTPSFQEMARGHWLYRVIPRHRSQIEWYDALHWVTWALWGNDDDGIFGEEPSAHYRPQQPPSIEKACCWAWRNPLHNFTFYVIGSADCINDELTILRLTNRRCEALVYRPYAKTVFADPDSCFYFGLHSYKPFVSWKVVWSDRYETRFYVGWRCRGNFGLRFNPWTIRKCARSTCAEKCSSGV